MGFWNAISEFFNGPNTSQGDFKPNGEFARVSDRAITPDDRSTPGLYTSGDAVRKYEALVFSDSPDTLTKEDVRELAAIVKASEQLVEVTTDYKNLTKELAKNETKITRNFAQLKPYVAKQHAYQNREHNKMLHGMDGAAIQYQANRTGRLKGSQRTRQIIGQMQQQQRMLRG
jgi:hypothetical protein